MSVFYLILYIIVIVGGIFMALNPEKIYYFQQSFRTNDPGEPRKSYLKSTRFMGWFLALLGLVCVILYFVCLRPGVSPKP